MSLGLDGLGGASGGKAPRRIAAIVLSRLVCEVAEAHVAPLDPARGSSRGERAPLAVLLDEVAEVGEAREASGADVIDAVDEAARALGVRPGQRVTEAMACSAHLRVVHVPRARVLAALTTVAEIALSFGVVVHVAPLDAVWLDVSGVAHLFGGEEALRAEIEARVSSIGLRASVAIADGPRIAEALARHHGRPGVTSIAPRGRGAEALAPLTIGALPLGDEVRSLFARLGVLTVGDFARLPRAQVVSRLGARAAEVMALAMGYDQLPLEPYRAPEVLVDEASFEDGVETAPQLLFVLRGMVSRLSARLLGRAQATNRIAMRIAYDRSIFRLRTAEGASPPSPTTSEAPEILTVVELPAPLAHEGDLLRAVKAKLEQIELVAPAVGLRLELSRVVAAPRIQLDLSRDVTVSPDALPALLSELAAEIGASAIGVLSLASTFRPEARSVLVPVGESNVDPEGRLSSVGGASGVISSPEPPRLLPEPIPISSLDDAISRSSEAKGSDVASAPLFVGNEPFEIVRVSFDRRLDGVEWWAPSSASRDYLRVLVRSPQAASGSAPALVAEAWVYIDRRTGESFLQGWWE